jgi:hypothetical protein
MTHRYRTVRITKSKYDGKKQWLVKVGVGKHKHGSLHDTMQDAKDYIDRVLGKR